MNPSVNISRYQRLDGTVLKLIACLSMFIDHLGAVCFSGMMGFRIIGRLAFPIYCFLLVEGAVHTRNMKKYILRMGIFALISEVPFDLAFYHRLVYTGHQNVFFTLGLGLLAIWFLEHPIEQLDIPDVLYKLLVIIAAGLIAEFFNTDYGFTGIAVIYAVLALIPILLYNGQRGRQTKVMQYGFYIFYPAHLLLIAALYHLFIL